MRFPPFWPLLDRKDESEHGRRYELRKRPAKAVLTVAGSGCGLDGGNRGGGEIPG